MDSTKPTLTPHPLTPFQQRMAMVALMSAVVLATLDTTISNTALPQIARELHTTEAAIIWVANAYQIAMIAALLPLASLGELIGYRRVYVGGVCFFTVASLACGLAPSLGWITAARAFQGIGAAAIMGVNTAFIRHIYPPAKLGHGISVNALIVAIGFTLGPPLASAILSVASWHWLFLFNVPIGCAVIPLALAFLPNAAGTRHAFDYGAAALCAAFLGLLAFSFCILGNSADGRDAAIAAVACVVCLAALLKKQAAHPAPMLAVDLLKKPAVGLSSATAICAFATQSLAFVSLPFFFQDTVGVSLVSTGLLLMTWPIVVAVMAVLVRPLGDRYPAAVLCSAGLIVLAAGMVALATLPAAASHAGIIVRLAVCGMGFGLFQAPNMKAIMVNAPPHRSGGASGIVAISRLMGQACGAAAVAQCFHLWQQQGPQLALWLGGGTAALGCLFSALRLRAKARD
jgi:DHA2 family multidrug resistance protein-like MFS transporter